MVTTNTLDRFDLAIVEALRENARLTITELAELVGLTKTPVQLRLKRLVNDGIIRGFHARVDHALLGRSHVAFVQVRLDKTTARALEAFNQAVREIGTIEQCHMIAGDYDYLLKVRTADIETYREVLGERISALPHVAHTATHVAMLSVVDNG
ncbi:MAG: Lrp/AsnC family transcriptional regulator [Pseudomonadota bacterium]